jgi:predicted phage terminase large subunit-like protein
LEIDKWTDDEIDQTIRDIQYQKGLDSLFYLAKELLEHNKMTEQEHGELCRLLQEWIGKKQIMLMPRGTYKSSIITDGYVTWRILKNPNIRILVFSETYSKAVDYILHLKDHLERPKFKDVYGNMKDETYWRSDGFRVSTRTEIDKEPTVMPGGIDKPATGKHFNLIICEDILGETNTNTIDQLEKVKKRFEELVSLLVNEPDSMILIVGTMWDEADLYADIITKKEGVKEWEKLLQQRILIGQYWNVYIRRAKEPDGTINFPNILPNDKLTAIASDQTTRKFKLQYFNDPTLRMNSAFETEWIEAAKEAWRKIPKQDNGRPVTDSIWVLVDPAVSKSPDADYTGIIVIGVKGEMWYILEAYQERLDSQESISAILDMVNRYGAKRVAIECVAFQKVLASWLKDEKRKRGMYFNLIEFNPGTIKSKESRIESLVPRFRAGTIAFNADFEDLEFQLRRFPNFGAREHDDLVDALSIGCQVIKSITPVAGYPEDEKETITPLIKSTGY